MLLACTSVFAVVPKVIFDADMYTDFDDVGSLAVLHALADAGECEILGTVASVHGEAPATGMIELLNDFYGRGYLPIGAPRSTPDCVGVGPDVDPGAKKNKSYRLYVDMVKARPNLKYPTCDKVPDANGVYRKLLAGAPDGSVTIVSTGFTTNLRRLLETKGDAVSPLDGRALVAKKVKAWYAMACRFPKGREYNSATDGESSRRAFGQFPAPIYFLDVCYGGNVYCGAPASRLTDEVNPVRDAFKRALREYRQEKNGHQAWDEITVLASIRGWEKYFGTERGRFDIVDARGTNVWTKDDKGNHYVLTVKTPKVEVGRIVDELIARRPRAMSKK